MDDLRARLRSLSDILGKSFSGKHLDISGTARLVPLSARLLIALHEDASLWLLRPSSSITSSRKLGVQGARKLNLSQALAKDPHSLIPYRASSCVAVVSPTSVDVVTIDTATAYGTVVPVGTGLFARRPGLRILHVAWHPRADSYLMILTSDGCLRLFDVVSAAAAQTEASRYRIVTTGDAPTSFAFGHADGWDSLAVYVLTEDGSIFVAAPIAPPGTRVSFASWSAMKRNADQAIGVSGDQCHLSVTPVPDTYQRTYRNKTPLSAQGNTSSTKNSSARRHLNFAALDDDGDDDDADAFEDSGRNVDPDPYNQRQPLHDDFVVVANTAERNETAWTIRQARMQLQFLEGVFERTEAGDMLAMREFKLAPLLFQGPLHIDLDDQDGPTTSEAAIFGQLTILDCGARAPPILLRSSRNGEVSVLIGIEAVEGQWFVGEHSSATTDERALASNAEYVRSASLVAPSLLCFEHLKFPVSELVHMHPVRGKTDSDSLFAQTKAEVYSVHLSFLSALRSEDALRSSKPSVISPLLSTAPLGSTGHETIVIGLSPIFEQGLGPLGIALTNSYVLEATSPLRWMFDYSAEILSSSSLMAKKAHLAIAPNGTDFLTHGEDSNLEIAVRNAKSRSTVASEIAEVIEYVHAERKVNAWAVGRGSVGVVGAAKSVSDIINCFEARLTAYTGSEEGQFGVCDHLKSLGVLIPSWLDEIHRRAVALQKSTDLVEHETLAKGTESSSLTIKLRRVCDLNENLRGRVSTIRKLLHVKQTSLTPSELARYAKLKEKKKRLAFLGRRIEELTLAVKTAREVAHRKRTSRDRESSPHTKNAIGKLSGSPFAQRRGPAMSRGSPRLRTYGTGGSTGFVDDELASIELQKIKETVLQHSESIRLATEKISALWEQFSVL